MRKFTPVVALFLVLAVIALAQRRGGRGFGGWGGPPEDPAGGTWGEGGYIGPEVKTPREVQSHSTGTPVWLNPRGFEKDTFTFARVRRARGARTYGGNWATALYRRSKTSSRSCSGEKPGRFRLYSGS